MLRAVSFVIISVFAYLGALAVAPTIAERDSVEEIAGILHFAGRPLDGLLVERFPDGSIYRQTGYRLGLKNGMALEYGFTGALRARENFRAGKKEGTQLGWYIEGPRKFAARYRDGVLDGEQSEWYLNGALFRRQEFANGVEVSKKILYATSEIYTNYVKKNGRVFGVDGGPLCFEPDKRDGEK